MALLKFELKEDHIKLLKNLKWSINEVTNYIVSTGNGDEFGESPFGGDNIIEDMYIILYGKPDEFDILNDSIIEINQSDIENMETLFSELPMALDIILYTGSFEPGSYKTKWYDRNWTKLTSKI